MTIHEHLRSLNACEQAQIWASTRLTGQQCWDECEKINWIFWWTARTGQTAGVIKAANEIANSVDYLKKSTNFDASNYAYRAGFAVANTSTFYTAANAFFYSIYLAYQVANLAICAVIAANTAVSATAQRLLNMKIAKENLVCPFVG
jgi:hypothetical protein